MINETRIVIAMQKLAEDYSISTQHVANGAGALREYTEYVLSINTRSSAARLHCPLSKIPDKLDPGVAYIEARTLLNEQHSSLSIVVMCACLVHEVLNDKFLVTDIDDEIIRLLIACKKTGAQHSGLLFMVMTYICVHLGHGCGLSSEIVLAVMRECMDYADHGMMMGWEDD